MTFTVPSIVLGYIAGVYVDQFSLKKVLVFTNLIRAFAIIVLFAFLQLPYFLFPVVLILAIATTFFIPAEGATIPALVADKQLPAANGLFSLTLQVSVVIGFLLGGVSLKTFGIQTAVTIIFGLLISSLLFCVFLPKSIRSETFSQERNVLKRFIQGIIFVFSTKKVRDSLFFLTLTSTIIFIILTIGPGYLDQVLEKDVKDAAYMLIVPAVIGMGVGSLFLSHVADRLEERKWINIGLFGLSLTFLGLALLEKTTHYWFNQIIPGLLLFFLGIENALITIPTTTAFQKNTPEYLRGRAYGLLGTFISGFAALPVLLSGALSDLFGVRLVLMGLCVVVLIFGIYRLRPRRV